LPFNPSLLSSYLAVAEIGKIALAAKALNLSQPAVTAQIARLERELKIKCFVRSVHGVQLTVEGQRIYEISKSIKEKMEIASQLSNASDSTHGDLKIAASTTIGDHLLPPILADFAIRFPSVDVHLSVTSTKNILELSTGVDQFIGLVEGLPRAPRLRLEKLIDDEIFMVAHPELSEKIRGVSDVKDYHIIWREMGSGTRAVVEKALLRYLKRKEISYKYQFGSSEAVKAAVLNKLGIGFLSRWSIENELALGRLKIIPIGRFRIERQFSWVFPSPGPTDLQSKFIEYVRSRLSVNPAYYAG
jgi:DNA-binding transcriptional LysR family regulator